MVMSTVGAICATASYFRGGTAADDDQIGTKARDRFQIGFEQRPDRSRARGVDVGQQQRAGDADQRHAKRLQRVDGGGVHRDDARRGVGQFDRAACGVEGGGAGPDRRGKAKACGGGE
ncbi:hypothetical protein PE067_01930 [Paracoccus sp. DMF-8]|uniref:hypothetical protein n=1 Tax=Paracoccus sp. DMF-8 TaxID=3019445 RepID=UPI0023E7901A|nr:hypothetical protein [Paracoccus sp. DMF-8]MDF3605025.1 hypothetical protein [Paracoccus sp. DMF-8]